VPPFRNDPAEWQRIDWQLLRTGSVTLFWKIEVLDETVRWLSENDYRIHELDASGWTSTDTALNALADALNFPDYFGHNFNALADCMGDVAVFSYGSDENSMGTEIALTHFDLYAERELDALTSPRHRRCRIGVAVRQST
jgi:hypothetical protein